MEGRDDCLTKIKNRNKNKHEQSKKHKCFSNLIINKYIVRNVEIDEFKEILPSYYDKQKKKIDNFTVRVIWKKNNEIVHEIKLSNRIII